MKENPRKHVSSEPFGESSFRRLQRGLRGFWLLTVAGTAICCLLYVRHTSLTAAAPLSPLSGRINPNTAPAGSLIRLEGIGPARAFDIIKYRRARQSRGEIAFGMPHDLEVVRGIGSRTVEKLAGSLEFEETKRE